MTAKRIEVYGHRGARAVFPENTLPGFEYTIGLGVDGFEFDINVTKDNVLVVSHDSVLHGPICKGPAEYAVIHELTLQQVKHWECGGVNPEFPRQKALPGERIPTLDEVFALSLKGDFRFLIEAKSATRRLTEEQARKLLKRLSRQELSKEEENRQVHLLMIPGPDLTPPPDEFAQMILDRIRAHHLENRVDFLSTDYRLLHSMRRLAPEISISAPYGGKTQMADVIKETSPDIVGPAYTTTRVTATEISLAHEAGIKMIPFGNEKEDWGAYVEGGADGIISDDPAAVIEFLISKGLR
jgi:glycerophosphoryl diester phosphodiesterase